MSSINYQPAFQSQHNECCIQSTPTPRTGCSKGSSPPCKTLLSDLPSLAAEVALAILHRNAQGPSQAPVQWQTRPVMAGQPRCCSSRRLCWDCRSFAEVMSVRETRPEGELRTAWGDFSPPVAPGHAWAWMKAVWDNLQHCWWLMDCL